MKVCPECGTQYENHVPTCIADGAELVEEATVLLRRLPAPPPALEPPRRSGGMFALGLGAAVGSLGIALLLLAVVALFRVLGGSSAPTTVPPPPPRPEPVAVERKEQPTVEVALVSEPLGAKVYENDQFVCETPCAVQHPAHAPLPRFFVFKANGFRDKVFEMIEVSEPISVELSHLRPTSQNNPSPSPAMPRPSIGRER